MANSPFYRQRTICTLACLKRPGKPRWRREGAQRKRKEEGTGGTVHCPNQLWETHTNNLQSAVQHSNIYFCGCVGVGAPMAGYGWVALAARRLSLSIKAGASATATAPPTAQAATGTGTCCTSCTVAVTVTQSLLQLQFQLQLGESLSLAVPVFYASVAFFDTHRHCSSCSCSCPCPCLLAILRTFLDCRRPFEEPFRFAFWITAAALSAIDQLWWHG